MATPCQAPVHLLTTMMVAHCDLKPNNIVVVNYKRKRIKKSGYLHVKLVDFGISKVEVNGLQIPTDGPPHGTFGYMAPEVKNLKKIYIFRKD